MGIFIISNEAAMCDRKDYSYPHYQFVDRIWLLGPFIVDVISVSKKHHMAHSTDSFFVLGNKGAIVFFNQEGGEGGG